MHDDEIERAYNTLSMLHSETLLENRRLQREIDRLAGSWHKACWYWVRKKLGVIKEWE